jgi:hypothetical protein
MYEANVREGISEENPVREGILSASFSQII